MKNKNQPLGKIGQVATYSPTKLVTTVSSNSSIENGRLESFGFEHQEKFHYIKIVSDYVNENIPSFKSIWPFLGAYTINGHWDPKIDEDLEFIGIAHYTVLKSLSYIFQNKDSIKMNDPNQRYKNIIFHYALIIDCIKQISFHILKFKNKLDSDFKPPINKLSKEEFLRKMEVWYDQFYNDQFESFTKVGGLVMNEIHSVKSHIAQLNVNNKLKSFNQFSSIIGPLRNVFIHNPSIDIFYHGNKPFVVKPKYIKTSRSIQSITELNIQDIIDPKVLMDQLFLQSTKMLADVWTVFKAEIELINSHENFKILKYKLTQSLTDIK
jgi:hypothetical protein